MRENDFLRFVYESVPAHGEVPITVGDDMAGVRLSCGGEGPGGEFPNSGDRGGNRGTQAGGGGAGGGAALALLKIDQCLDRVHFDVREHSAKQAGTKAVNRCLSDCAAMACLPAGVMVSVALPREGAGSGEAFAQELFLACRDAAGKFDCPVVGGDTAVWDGRLVIVVSALGKLPQGGRAITRGGAKVGDTLFVSGALGGSILGRHLSFEPRVALALALARAAGEGLHAMMDLSDGLAADLPRICAASGVGAEVHGGRLPLHEDAWKLSEKDGLPAGLHGLVDGEDYELLFAMDPEAVPEIVGIGERLGVPVTAVGTVVAAGKGLVLVDDAGRKLPWPRGGWEHGG